MRAHGSDKRRLAVVAAALLAGAGVVHAETVELRGAWVWGRTCADEAAADKMLRRAASMNLNALYVLVFYDGATAYHRSDLVATSGHVAEGFDPLGHLVREGAKRGIEIHAWFVNGPIRRLTEARVLREHPDWQAVDLAGRKVDWYDLCNPAVRAWQARLMVELAGRYAVRGVHFDYIRFNGMGLSASAAARRAAARDGIDVDALCYAKLPAYGAFHGNPLAEPTTARVLAMFHGGVPAIAVNRLGRGEVFLLNWHAHQNPPRAVHRAVGAILKRLGAAPGGGVGVLDTDLTGEGRYSHRRYADAAAWITSLGYRPKRLRDRDLATPPAGLAIVLPQHYCMTEPQARALVAHVRGGGGAVFLDGPVYAVRDGQAARTLLGFRRMGRYFKGERVLSAAAAGKDLAGLVPAGGRELTVEAERDKLRAWNRWRKDQVTRLVADVHRQVEKLRRDCLVTAAVFRTRDSADRVAQDWPRWLREGLVDYAIPMSYVATAAELKEHFAWWKTFDPKLERTIPAVGAFRIGVDLPPADRAARIAEQIDCCRRQGARGFVMFVLAKIDDETAAALGRTALKGKARPYAPGQQGGRRPLR